MFMLFKPLLPIVEYVVFYDYFKNELCENKEKPELECNGKCHLAKEMAKASDTPENGKDKKQISIETSIVFYQELSEDFTEIKPVILEYKSKITPYHNSSYSYLEADSLFHPPILV